MRKFLAVCISVIVFISILPIGIIVSASGNNGRCGENVYWNFDEDTCILTISGYGTIWDYDSKSRDNQSPFSDSYFYDRVNEIIIENGITGIGSYAFYDLGTVKCITIPESVTYIGYEAFSWCRPDTINYNAVNAKHSSAYLYFFDDAKEINIGNKVKNIPERFLFSDKITELTIPENVTHIEEDAFSCGNLEVLNFNASYCEVETYWIDLDDLEINFGSSVRKVPAYFASGCSTLKSIRLPDSITSIGDYAFSCCVNLTDVNFPENLTSIGNYAFNNCISLSTDIILPESVTSIGKCAFYMCLKVKNVTIPKNVKTIGGNSFFGVSAEELNYNAVSAKVNYGINYYSVSDIELGWFYSFAEKFEVNIGENVKSIPDMFMSYEYAGFLGVVSYSVDSEITDIDDMYKGVYVSVDDLYLQDDNYTYLNIPDDYDKKPLYIGGKLKEIRIPESVTSIGDYAFAYCFLLTEIEIPKNVTNIGGEAFSNCFLLSKITIPNNITAIGKGTFAGCASLTEVIIPDSVTDIDSSAFQQCKNLESVTIGKCVSKIGSNIFYDCPKLKTVNYNAISIPDNKYPVLSSDTIQTVNIGNKVEKIPDYFISECTGVSEITIPHSVKEIGEYAFYHCSGLKDVYYNGTEAEWNEIEIKEYNSSLKGANIHFLGYSEPVYYTISFNVNGGDSSIQNRRISKGDYAVLPTAVRSGYSLLGWATERGGEVKYNIGEQFSPTGDITFYAVWEKIADTETEVSLPNEVIIEYKITGKITPAVSVEGNVKYTVEYSSSDPSVATVDKDGNITTLHKGETTITCTVTDEYGNVAKDTCIVTVKFQWWQWVIWILLFGFLWY